MKTTSTHAAIALALMLTLGCSPRESSDEHPREVETGEATTDEEPTTDEKKAAGDEGAHAHGAGSEPSTLPEGFEGPGKLELPEDLRGLLVAEMVQIESAMHRILSALVRGELAKVQKDAQGVRDSFILAQKLTKDQAAKLGELLPSEMVTLDRRFHGQAAALAKAAGAGNASRAAAIYAEMTTSCVDCHRAFARERFPGVAASGEGISVEHAGDDTAGEVHEAPAHAH